MLSAPYRSVLNIALRRTMRAPRCTFTPEILVLAVLLRSPTVTSSPRFNHGVETTFDCGGRFYGVPVAIQGKEKFEVLGEMKLL